MRVKAIRFLCTRSLLYPGFDNCEFLSLYFGSNGKKNLITYLLPWGWSVEWKTLLYTDQPQEDKKHVYIFADCDDVPVIVTI